MTIADLNRMNDATLLAALTNVLEHSPWVAREAIRARPFANIDALHAALMDAVRRAPIDRQLALLRAHPELAGKEASRGTLTRESTQEQSGAGLDQCTPEELAKLDALNAKYREKFGFPFILAVKPYDRAGILSEFARRVERDNTSEFREALEQVSRITRFRLESRFESG